MPLFKLLSNQNSTKQIFGRSCHFIPVGSSGESRQRRTCSSICGIPLITLQAQVIGRFYLPAQQQVIQAAYNLRVHSTFFRFINANCIRCQGQSVILVSLRRTRASSEEIKLVESVTITGLFSVTGVPCLMLMPPTSNTSAAICS